MTAAILNALEEHYRRLNRIIAAPEWACFRELATWTGFTPRLIDFYAFNCWHSKGFLRVAYEVKISRGDFKRELAEPAKREPAMKLCNEFYFICPEGMLRADEIPAGCGLRDVSETGRIRTRLRAPRREVGEPALPFMASLARRVATMEKELSAPAPEATIPTGAE
jgi:hypothetical protein